MGTRGDLLLMDANNTIIWSTNSSGSLDNPVAQLLDSGNLVVRDENNINPDAYRWQSFDHPVDNLLPGMKLGWDLVKGLERNLNSWKSPDDPSSGEYTAGISLDGYPQLVLRSGSDLQYRLGSWDGMQFSNKSTCTQTKDLTDKFVINDNEVYYSYGVWNKLIIMRMLLTPGGTLLLLTWNDQNQSWDIYFRAQNDTCKSYALCGAYGNCYSTGCQCFKGFHPKNIDNWLVANWSDGCVRKTQLKCDGSDGFEKFTAIRLPDTRHALFHPNKDVVYCRTECLLNCSCIAYAYMDITEGGTGCLLWFDELTDIGVDKSQSLDLYIRFPASVLGENRHSILKRAGFATGGILVALLLLGLFLIHVVKKRKEKVRAIQKSDTTDLNKGEDMDLPLFEFTAIADATSNFSISNKLGQGGFGPVYKGILEDGKEIAVKRLSRNSKQGLLEFKNEISCIAKLQHRNLVRLLGCCSKEGEMLLVYEYMPNRSLDSITFDKELSKSLDWLKRYNIVKGIARGLLYLHQDSRLRIIHRDLKASNILLDYEKNPKISDFGLARSFGGSEIEVNTTKVAGTHGYMSPEYLIDGVFSIKSDVYSFGVVVLEIVSGEKIRDFRHPDEDTNLLGYAWKLYVEGNCLELVDRAIMESCNSSEVLRVIQISLLCVQPYARDRPTMSSVVAMLSSENELPQPQQPGFFTQRQLHDPKGSADKINFPTANELTATFYAPR
ncbi:Receptor-like serine/threonine-protein kinase [Heracleum sosnowskyi]|uniref:Receptor-like serine/threonine-protein kinase n=1 Tax=Heracleum sosnowskyi TaxID=360622 RepID=A0AAD8HLU4_9APIA|nr:Receptor-like serine/threonine-protein kinase [Heracleum sosnowskyi]